MNARTKTGGAYFALALIVLTILYSRGFLGFQSDALYYYSTAVSVVWDRDFDLRDQYNHPLAGTPGGTVASGQYFTDRTTGKAFTLFNPGTGFLLVPSLLIARGIDSLRGDRHPDPYDPYYQRVAGYTAVLLTALTLLLLSSILGRFLSPGPAIVFPLLFLLGTNWLFYAVVFSGWSHVYALFLTVFLAWAALRRAERRDFPSAALFGLAGGALFTTRNFGVLIFVFLAVGLAAVELRARPRPKVFKLLAAGAAAGLGFLVTAVPQLYFNAVLHGNPFKTSFAAAVDAVKPFGFLESEPFHVLSLSNLPYLVSNLFNLDNGLFVLHPLFLVGLAGAVIYRPRGTNLRMLTLSLAAATGIFWFIDAAYYDNWFLRAAGSGFGHRRFLDLLPIFCLGAAFLWDKARARKGARFVAAFLFSLLCSAGIVLLYDFSFASKELFRAKSSVFDFYAFLLKDWRTVVLTAAFFSAYLALEKIRRREDGHPAAVARRNPLIVGAVLAAMVIPMAAFRPTPAWERERFIPKKGFFLIYSLIPYVQTRGREWGWPENLGRPLNGASAAIGLPAPLEKGDSLLLRLRPNFEPDGEASLEVGLGDAVLGRAPLRSGDQVYTFPVEKDFGRAKKLTLKITPPPPVRPGAPSATVVEGRVLFRGIDDPPFGHVDAPAEEKSAVSGSVILEGWTLDDRGLARVAAVVEPGIAEVEAAFPEGARPEIAGIFVIYPDIHRTGWKIEIDPEKNPELYGRIVRVRVVAEDLAGHRTTLGRRIFYFREKSPHTAHSSSPFSKGGSRGISLNIR